MATTTAPLCKMMDDYVTWEVVVSCSDESRREAACNGLKGFAQTYLQEGRWGLVNAVVMRNDTELALYLTAHHASKDSNRARDIKAHVEKFGWTHTQRLGAYVTVTSVKFFTKVTQRRLGWATANVQRQDVETAVEKEDHVELLALMPAARGYIDSGDLDLVPQLFDRLQSNQLALTDCVHELVYNGTKSRFSNGPCNKCSKSKTEQRTCCKCNLSWCMECACRRLWKRRRSAK